MEKEETNVDGGGGDKERVKERRVREEEGEEVERREQVHEPEDERLLDVTSLLVAHLRHVPSSRRPVPCASPTCRTSIMRARVLTS